MNQLTKFRIVPLMSCLTFFALGGGARGADESNLQFEGFVEAREDAQLAFAETGVLARILVRVGDHVQAGQMLAVMDDDLQQSHVRIAQAQAAMLGALRGARAEHQLQLLRTQQLRSLHRENLARPDELARAEADLEIAAGRLLAAEEDKQLQQLELERAQVQLQRRSLQAPFDGVVTRIMRRAGEFVSPQDPVVVRLIAVDSLVAVVNIPAERLSEIGQETQVRVNTTAPPSVVVATIASITPAIDGESGTVQVRASFENPQGRCRAGDRCIVTFLPDELKSATIQRRGRENR